MIATVVAGLVCGWYQHVVLSAAVRVRSLSFWHVMIFLLEASVFILIGFELGKSSKEQAASTWCWTRWQSRLSGSFWR